MPKVASSRATRKGKEKAEENPVARRKRYVTPPPDQMQITSDLTLSKPQSRSRRAPSPEDVTAIPFPAFSPAASATLSLGSPPSSQENDAGPAEAPPHPGARWRFTFGRHAGTPIDEVDKNYIVWLKDRGLGEINRYPGLLEAMLAWDEKERVYLRTAFAADAQYTLRFGEYEGKPITDVPEEYIDWIIKERLHTRDEKLYEGLEGAIRYWDMARKTERVNWKKPSKLRSP